MIKSTLLTAVSFMLLTGIGVAYSQQSLPQDAEPLSAAELRDLYSDRTWRWDDGAGYFAPDGVFHAVTEEQGEHAYTMGTWNTADQGQLCFEGEWNSRDDSGEVTTCFSHRQANGTIWQRAEPDGEWTVFRSPDEAGEYARFAQGDWVTVK
jgi:hypothetical protein